MRRRLPSLALATTALVASFAHPSALEAAPPKATAPAAKVAPAAPVALASSVASVDAVTRYTLGNGLDVILHEDHRTPVVAVNVWYHVGSKDEPKGKNGFAHLFEHLMFQGSKHVGEDMFFRYLERAGASERNGTTNTDRTNYFEVVPKTQLPLVLWLESDRMGTLLDHVDQATFESQREVVKNERRQSYENAPYGMVWALTRAALYPEGHPYHLTTIGTPEDLDAASLDDVRAFFRTWYVPNNASLVIAGDIDVARTKELVEKYFGPIAKGPEAKPAKEAMTIKLPKSKKLVVEAEVELPRLQIAWPSPRGYAPGDADLDLVAHVLGGGKSSRLHKRLVYDLQIAQDVSVWQDSSLLAGDFGVSVTLRAGHTPEEALKIVDEEIAALGKKAPSSDEIERGRTEITSGMVFGRERLATRADTFNFYAQTVGDPGFFGKDLARYAAATPITVQKAALDWLAKGKRVVTVVRPTKGAPRSGKQVSLEETDK
jgi:predicted Zn-dependent peptidase